MMKFRVTLRHEDGSEEKRDIEAQSRFAVYEAAEKEQATVLAVEEMKGGGLAKLSQIKFGTGINMEQRITFTKNLAAMLTAGLVLSRALSVIERQSGNKNVKDIAVDLQSRVKQGSSFHEALAAHPAVFPKLFVAMVKAGEESGQLAESLSVLARQMEKSFTLQKKVKGAMIYPAIIVTAILVIGVLMMIFVVPTLSATFGSLGVELPATTKAIIATSDFMSANIAVTLGLLVAFLAGVFFFFKSKTGSALILRASLYMPVIGELVRETMSARAARALSSLLSSGVDMLLAISIAREVVGAKLFAAVLEEAEERVRKGEPLSAAFMEHHKLYPVFMGDMIAVGEETGKVSEMLGQVAQYYETDVEDRTKDLSTIIEPMLMLLIGVFVGFFALSMIAPIYSLSDKI